jgi:plastocyanin
MTLPFRSLTLIPMLCLIAACSGGGTSTSPSTTGVTGTTGTGGSTPTTPAANEVIAGNGTSFNPATLTVTKGTTVNFTFQATTHNVTFGATTGAPASISNTTNQTVGRTFSTAGTFAYQCTLHGGMTGTVIVN